LARPLSRHSDMVMESLPVYGVDQNSQIAGTCASRLGPPMPSAMLNTMSGRRSWSRRGRSSLASTRITLPARERAASTAAIVASSSHSAYRSPESAPEALGFTLYVNAIRINCGRS
jgi:hypothetical protein